MQRKCANSHKTVGLTKAKRTATNRKATKQLPILASYRRNVGTLISGQTSCRKGKCHSGSVQAAIEGENFNLNCARMIESDDGDDDDDDVHDDYGNEGAGCSFTFNFDCTFASHMKRCIQLE